MAQGSFLGRWLRTTATLLVLGAAAATALFYLHGRRGEVDGLFRALPAQAGNVIVARHVDGLLAALGRLADAPRAPAELRRFRDDLRKQGQAQLGFDPADPEGWRKAGFDPAGPYALSTSDRPDDGLVFAYLPLADATAARGTLGKALQALGARLEKSEAEGPELTRVVWPVTALGNTAPRAFAVQDGFLVIAAAAGATDGEAVLRKQLAAHGLLEQPAFRAVRAAVGEPWTLFDYSAPALAEHQLQLQHAEALGTWVRQGVGAALEIDDARVELRVRALGDAAVPGAHPLLLPAHPPGDHAGGSALAVGRVSLDLREVAERLKQNPDTQKQLDALAAALTAAGLDLQRDVIDGFDGQLTAALLAPPQGGKGKAVAVLAAGVREPKKLFEALRAPLGKLGGEPHGPGLALSPGMLLQPTSDALVLLFGADDGVLDVEKAVAAGGPGFSAKLAPEQRQAFEHGPAAYGWVDAERGAELLSHETTPGVAQGARVLGALQSASLGLDARDGVLRFDLDLFPPPGGFGQAIAHAGPGGP
jgi:hypothetical protein